MVFSLHMNLEWKLLVENSKKRARKLENDWYKTRKRLIENFFYIFLELDIIFQNDPRGNCSTTFSNKMP